SNSVPLPCPVSLALTVRQASKLLPAHATKARGRRRMTPERDGERRRAGETTHLPGDTLRRCRSPLCPPRLNQSGPIQSSVQFSPSELAPLQIGCKQTNFDYYY